MGKLNHLEVHKRLNEKQEERYIKFAEKRWSIKNNLGYKYLQKLSKEDVVRMTDGYC
jgi:hypothetical protein